MAEEILDIVNEQDKVIGQGTREQIHREHLIHRDVHVFVVNSKGELLIQLRKDDLKTYPGYLDAAVGGHVGAGESYETAAARETEEELGITPSELIKIVDYHSYSSRQRANRRLFVCHHEGPFVKGEDVEALIFKQIEEIKAELAAGKLYTKGFTISLEHYLRFNEGDK